MTERQFALALDEVRAKLRSEVLPFEDTSPEAVAERKLKAEADLQAFGETYLPHYFTDKPASWHPELDDLLAKLNRQIAAVHGHREGAKTVRYVIAFALQQHLAADGEPFIVVVSATKDLAGDFVACIKTELEENQRIRADYGEMPAYPWSTEDLVSTNGRRIRALGAGQKMRGALFRMHKPTLAICDDLEDDELAMNPKRVKKLYQWLFSTLVPMLQKKRWRVVVLGTLICKGCFLDKLQTQAVEEKRPVVAKRYPAILKDSNGRERSSWPDRFSLTDWREFKATVGTLIWAAEFQGEPSDEDATIPEELITSTQWRDGELDGVEFEAVAVGYDPIPGKAADEVVEAKEKDEDKPEKKKDGSYAAIIKVARCSQGHLWVMDAWIKRRSVVKQVRAFVDFFVFGPRPQKMAAETVAFATLVMNELGREEVARGVRLPVEEIKQTGSKEVRLKSLQPYFERKLVHLNLAQGDQELLKEQLVHLDNPNIEDDGPDALEMAIRKLEGLVKPAAVGRTQTKAERRPGRKGRLFGTRPVPEPEGEEEETEDEAVSEVEEVRA